jgi:hypothetical protein
MLEFTFADFRGTPLYTTTKRPTDQCGGGCCFDEAVAEFRKTKMPEYVPGQLGVTITVKGI